MAAAARTVGAVELVSTLDLLDFAGVATWLPAPIEVPDFEPFRRPSTEGPLRIVHAPTKRLNKGTEAVIAHG